MATATPDDGIMAVADATRENKDRTRTYEVPQRSPQLTLTAPEPPKVSWTSPQSLAVLVGIVLSALGFALHKDLSDLAGPITTAATAVIAAAVAIEHAIKYNAYQRSVSYLNDQRFQVWSILVQNPDPNQMMQTMANYFAQLDARMLEAINGPSTAAVAPKTTRRPLARPKTSKKVAVKKTTARRSR